MAKPDGYRPKKLTDDELYNAVYQVVLKAALHNKNITVEELHETTKKLYDTVKSMFSK